MPDGSLLRESGKSKLSINKQGIITQRERDIPLDPIVSTSYKRNMKNQLQNTVVNDNIGTLDLETYDVAPNVSKVYALGFHTNLDS